jgi:hypothetical protein
VHTIVVLEVTAGQVAVPPLFKASDDVPVEVTASEKLIVTGMVSPIFLVPEPVVETEDTVGGVVSMINTDVPITPILILVPSTSAPETTIGVNGKGVDVPPTPDFAVKTAAPREDPVNPASLDPTNRTVESVFRLHRESDTDEPVHVLL